MAKEIKLHDLEDGDGFKLPKNMSVQFRSVQSGIEYLKGSADDITIELKGVNKKLKTTTQDLSTIISKVNDIEEKQKEHLKIMKDSFKEQKDMMNGILQILLKFDSRIETLEKKK